MERRTSERQFSVNDVTVSYSNLGLVKARSKDLSLGGICLDTGSVSLPVNAAVSVNFTIDSQDGPLACEAHAIVVRSDFSECCLMFDGMNETTHQALKSYVGDWQFVPGESFLKPFISL